MLIYVKVFRMQKHENMLKYRKRENRDEEGVISN